MRWSPSLSAVLSGGKVCSIQDLFPRRPSSVGRGGALPPADRPQRGGAIPSGGRSVRLGSPRRPSSVGSPPFPGRTWWWRRRYSKPAKAWAARGGDRWPSPVGLMARNNYQDFVELNVSTCGATDATAEVLTAVGNSQPEGNLVRRLEISLIRREDRPATATRATPACETFNSSIRAARPMETQPEASVGAAQADRRQLVPPAPGATAFKRGRPVTLLHQTGQGKNTVAQIHAGGATPPRRSSSVGETATPVTERSWECLRLTPGRSLLLRLFVSSILRLSEDVWFLHLCKIGRLLPQSL